MTNDGLEHYIKMYNSGNWDAPVSRYRLGSNVVLARVWSNYPSGAVVNEDSYKFYFIENGTECVAIVFEMGKDDLHWLVVESMRKKGYLHNALKETVFPFIFSDGRTEQRASADSEDNISYLLRQGFEERIDNGETAYYLSSDKVKPFDKTLVQRTPLSDDEFMKISQQLFKLAGELRIIRDQVECAYGDDCYIEEVANEIMGLGHDVEYKCKKT